jgi:MFS superfamily sulfate permease-like transporter
MSQTLVNETAGAKTPLSGLIAALITATVVVFFTGLLRTLPQPVLAAVVLMAVTGLIQIDVLRHTWRFSRTEFGVAMAALFGVLAAGLLQGVLIGVVISILLLIRRASRPRVAEVARVPGTSYFADVTRHPENQREPEVLVARPEGSLVYFNADHVRDALTAMVSRQPVPPRLVILFMGNVPHVDLAGAELLVHLRETFTGRGTEFRLAETRGPVREALRRLGSAHAAGLAEANQTVDGILSQWRAGHIGP